MTDLRPEGTFGGSAAFPDSGRYAKLAHPPLGPWRGAFCYYLKMWRWTLFARQYVLDMFPELMVS